MSEALRFRPDPAQATRCWLNAIWVWLAVVEWWAGPGALALAFMWEPMAGLCLYVLPKLLFVLVLYYYVPAWMERVWYEMTDEEIIVHKGVFGTVHTVVPYRTVTNVSVTRGWLDRKWLGIGNVVVETAGTAGDIGSGEVLVGLRNFEEIRDAVIAHLRRYRADTRPALGGGSSGAGLAAEPTGLGDEVARQILRELRAIRKALEAKA